jgi:hypothetical protein
MGGQVELRLEPLSGRFDVHDDRWLDQVSGLVDELRAEVGDVATRRTPEPGTKGGIDALLIPVVSAGWLTRDRTRSLKVSWSDRGAVDSIELSGSEVDSARFDDLLRLVTQNLAAGQ